MVARLKLKDIDGRAPPGVKPPQLLCACTQFGYGRATHLSCGEPPRRPGPMSASKDVGQRNNSASPLEGVSAADRLRLCYGGRFRD